MQNKEKVYKKPLGQLKIEKFCSDNNNLIQNYISNLYKNTNYKIKLMTNDDDVTNRYTHCGAHICVETSASNDYYYITTSRKDYLCQNFLTINVNLLDLIKQSTFNYKVLLFNGGKIYRFDKWAFDNIVKNESCFVNIPLDEAEDVFSYTKDDFFTPKHNVNIKWKMLGYVRYSKKFDMHKKKITIAAPDFRFRRTYGSQIEAYVDLTGTKVENGKVVGKPVSNAAYLKSYKQFLRDIRDNKLYVISDKGTSFQVTVVAETVDTKQLAANVSTSILVDNNKTTNIEVDTSVTDSCNKGNDGGEARLDKQLNTIAEKLVEKESTKYTPAEIQKNIIKFGSNRNMLTAYIESLTEKGLQKEAAYAAKVFEAINSIDFN